MHLWSHYTYAAEPGTFGHMYAAGTCNACIMMLKVFSFGHTNAVGTYEGRCMAGIVCYICQLEFANKLSFFAEFQWHFGSREPEGTLGLV